MKYPIPDDCIIIDKFYGEEQVEPFIFGATFCTCCYTKYIVSSLRVRKELESNRESITSFKKSISSRPCPICGGSLMILRSLYSDYNDNIQGNNIFKDPEFGKYKENFRQKLAALTTDRLSKNIQEWDVEVIADIPMSIGQLKNNPEKLKEYVLQLIHLETNIIALQSRLKRLYHDQFRYEKRVENEKCNFDSDYRRATEKVKELKEMQITIPVLKRPTKPNPPELVKVGLFNKKKAEAENAALNAKYKSDLQQYESIITSLEAEAVEEHEKSIEQAEQEVVSAKIRMESSLADYDETAPAALMKKSIDADIDNCEELLKKTYQCRNELYSYGVVFSKYQDIVALSTFYEYLMAGRCTSLEGADGAYNIYEAEIRADMIISQLSSVLEKLEDIKKNQYMLYSELHTVNQNLANLNSKMDTALQTLEKIEENTAQIEYNTAATAFYSKKNAELTNALGFMMALK